VRLLEDLCLPLSDPFCCFSFQESLDKDERVSLLIDDSTWRWDKEVVCEFFSPLEANVICSIPLSSRSKPDRLFWDGSKSGLFSVKSAYYLQAHQQAQGVEGESSVMRGEKVLEISMVTISSS
jgi:hypothetical protein